MYIQLLESEKFVSPIIYIHSDEEEFLDFILKWREDLIEWSKDRSSTPLSRLDVNTCIVDLVHKLSVYFINTVGKFLNTDDKITGCIRLFNYADIINEELHTININNGEITISIAKD